MSPKYSDIIIVKGDDLLATIKDEIKEKISNLSDNDKLELVDSILMQLDKPDPEIDRVWAKEAKSRWQAYKAGKTKTVSYDKLMNEFRKK